MDRIIDRSTTLLDVLAVVRRAARAEPHADPPRHGGSCWRVHGQDLEGRKLAVGIEAFVDEEERWAILCTVIELWKGR